jgi:hypothetical protein
MRFTASGGQTGAGPADRFTGTVYIDGIRNPDDHLRGRMRGSAVHPGCAYEADDEGRVVTWLDQVTDKEYGAR